MCAYHSKELGIPKEAWHHCVLADLALVQSQQEHLTFSKMSTLNLWFGAFPNHDNGIKEVFCKECLLSPYVFAIRQVDLQLNVLVWVYHVCSSSDCRSVCQA